MTNLNADLTDEELDASQLMDELRTTRTKYDELLRAHRQNNDALGHIAAAAGLLDFETLEELVAGVVVQLHAGLTAPPAEIAPPAPPTGLTCEACGDPGAVDLGDDVVLCSGCSGADMLAEGLPA